MWRIDLFLGNDREINNETTAVARQWQACQWIGWKAVYSAQSYPIACNNGYNKEEPCFIRGPCLDVISRTIWDVRQPPPEAHLTLNGRNIPFINHVKYLGVIFDKRITWRLHIQMTEAKAFRTFIRIYSV
jgi:hypothetical protein